jgi:hypothetical protein
VLREFGCVSPIWAIAGMIASVDPQVHVAARMFRSRIVNVLVGAAVGLVLSGLMSRLWPLSPG